MFWVSFFDCLVWVKICRFIEPNKGRCQWLLANIMTCMWGGLEFVLICGTGHNIVAHGILVIRFSCLNVIWGGFKHYLFGEFLI